MATLLLATVTALVTPATVLVIQVTARAMGGLGAQVILMGMETETEMGMEMGMGRDAEWVRE